MDRSGHRAYTGVRPARSPSPSSAAPLNRIGVASLLLLLATCAPIAAQAPHAGSGTRLGVSFGGISTVAVLVEIFDDAHGFEVAVGTWSFRDVSVSAVAKQYFGAGAAQPFVGAGLWAVAAAPGEERTGLALVLRAPVGVDIEMGGNHATGLAINVNRGLAVRRSDPEDDLPMSRRLIPLPEIYYRLTR